MTDEKRNLAHRRAVQGDWIMKISSIFGISAVAAMSLTTPAVSYEPTKAHSSESASVSKTDVTTCPTNLKAVIENGQIWCVGVNPTGVQIKCKPIAAAPPGVVDPQGGGDPLKGLNVGGSRGSGGSLC